MTAINQPTGILPVEVTRLRQRIAALEQQLAFGQTLLTMFPGGAVFVFDHELRYQQVHGNLLIDNDIDVQILQGKTIWEVLPPETIVVVEPAYRAALEGRQSTFETSFDRFYFTVYVLPVHTQEHKVIGGIAVAYDVTAHRQGEQALRKSQERLQFIIEGSNDGAWDTNLVTGETYISDRYKEMLGYHPAELPDQPDLWYQLMHPEDVSPVSQALQDYLTGTIRTYEIEQRLRHKSGEWRWFLGRGKVTMRDDQGTPVRITGTITDIHERKQAEEDLRTFKTLTENAPDAIAVANLDTGQISYANPAFCTLFGYGAATVGLPLANFYAGAEAEQLQTIIQAVLIHGAWQGVVTYQRKDGTTFPGLLSGMVLQDPVGKTYAIAGIIRDISAQVRAEEERTAMQEQIIRVQQAAIRELSTPLIPLAQGLVVMPLIGSMDSTRAQQVMETLLEGVAVQRATSAILDITGLQVVDTQVADALVRAARAVKLLGAQVIITGIRPEIAQTLVGMGADLSSIVTHGSLQKGVAYALRQQARTARETVARTFG